ncbi:MAG: lytic murein transglycosylase [Proteobacteria bacterium]|nr:lytic murein transglycosylase [Pseudomonadota bacterium]MBU1710316.1 lytic murein transglycosylase [Pseudomonadota bacterium]
MKQNNPTPSNTTPKIAGALFFFLIILLWNIPTTHAEDDFALWLEKLKQEAHAGGISPRTTEQAFHNVALNPQIIELDRNQPEFKRTLEQYLSAVVTKGRVDTGRAKLVEKQELLKIIAKQYGVPPRFVLALWGIETNFGTITGKSPVINSLVTLAYDARRGPYFRRELIHALHIIDAGHMTVNEMLGSWAGAMGYLQFMPSTFRGNAVDFDNNGKISLWEDGADLFASGSNYLKKSGWQTGWTWGREVLLPKGLDSGLIASQKLPLEQWRQLGVRKADGSDLAGAAITARIIQPDGPQGRAFMVYDNFDVILTWNRSYSFGIAVGLLADAIGGI